MLQKLTTTLWKIVILVLVVTSSASAQSTRATMRDSSDVSARTYERLFLEIALPRDERARAFEVIKRAFVSRQALYPIDSQEEWNKLIGIQNRRDSLLLALVEKSGDRKKLEERLEADRPRSSRWK
jgi:hypothetical protein